MVGRAGRGGLGGGEGQMDDGERREVQGREGVEEMKRERN